MRMVRQLPFLLLAALWSVVGAGRNPNVNELAASLEHGLSLDSRVEAMNSESHYSQDVLGSFIHPENVYAAYMDAFSQPALHTLMQAASVNMAPFCLAFAVLPINSLLPSPHANAPTFTGSIWQSLVVYFLQHVNIDPKNSAYGPLIESMLYHQLLHRPPPCPMSPTEAINWVATFRQAWEGFKHSHAASNFSYLSTHPSDRP